MEIFVNGIGSVSAGGSNVREFAETVRSGKSPLHKPTRFRTKLEFPVGEVPLSDIDLKQELGIEGIMSRTALLGLKAVREALADFGARTGVNKPCRVAFISGTSVGGMDLSEEFWEHNRDNFAGGDVQMLKMHDPGAVTDAMVQYLEAEGYIGSTVFVNTVSTACSAAGNAIMLGAKLLRLGEADVAIVGGTDSLCKFTMNGFNSLRILDPEICRPFDESRAGLNLGEGAGYLILSPNDAGAYCRLSGWGNANEAYHQTASTPEGIGPGLAMEAAIRSAGISPSEIDYVNTHGTGTQINDIAEMNAMNRVFGGKIPPFSSLKPFAGHTLGASEGIEAAWVCGMMKDRGYRHVLSSAFGFSGNCVSLVFSE